MWLLQSKVNTKTPAHGAHWPCVITGLKIAGGSGHVVYQYWHPCKQILYLSDISVATPIRTDTSLICNISCHTYVNRCSIISSISDHRDKKLMLYMCSISYHPDRYLILYLMRSRDWESVMREWRSRENAFVTPKGVLLLAKCHASATLEGFWASSRKHLPM